VGVTLDLGNGLYIPVVKDAHTRTVPEIAEILTGFRRSAQHGRFQERDMEDGNIVLTLHHDGAVVHAIPIVFPGQACALALAAPYQGTADITVAFDHRLAGGRQAALFLQDLKDLLEEPDQLSEPPAPAPR
jgi:2-oxoglutarate dehydrogenase E2 component (dihydrolipoamide succinyltransferase)